MVISLFQSFHFKNARVDIFEYVSVCISDFFNINS